MTDLLSRAIVIATEAHAGQVDKGGQPYILHPLRVMLAQRAELARIVAVLHDVVEDCPGWTLARLAEEGFPFGIVAGVDSVTRRKDEPYDVFIARAGDHLLGRQVKVADLIDNLDVSRLGRPPAASDIRRVARYRKALLDLGVNPPA